VQISHAVTGAVRRMPVLMERHVPSRATTPNKSSTAHARSDMLENSVRRKVLHLASSYNSKQKSKKVLMYQLFMILQATLSTKLCNFTSKNGFVWTVLDSFSLANKNHYKAQPLFQGYPVNQNSFKWKKFRLSQPIMNSTLSHSTHVRATCNFNTDGVVTRDYLRGKTTDLNFLLSPQDSCENMEYINIRGYDCYNCTARNYQIINWHLHFDSYYIDPCQFTRLSASNDAVQLPGGEDNFGYYQTINPLHRCKSGNDATTQWWFGAQ